MKTKALILLYLVSILSCQKEKGNNIESIETSQSVEDSIHVGKKFLKKNPKKKQEIQEFNQETFSKKFSLVYGRWKKVGVRPLLSPYAPDFTMKDSIFIELGTDSIFKEYTYDKLKNSNKYTIIDGPAYDVYLDFADHPMLMLYMIDRDTLEISPAQTDVNRDIFIRVERND